MPEEIARETTPHECQRGIEQALDIATGSRIFVRINAPARYVGGRDAEHLGISVGPVCLPIEQRLGLATHLDSTRMAGLWHIVYHEGHPEGAARVAILLAAAKQVATDNDGITLDIVPKANGHDMGTALSIYGGKTPERLVGQVGDFGGGKDTHKRFSSGQPWLGDTLPRYGIA